MAVVDGANEIDLFDLADLKVAFNAQEVVKKRADEQVDAKDLRVIVDLARTQLEKERRSSRPKA